MPRECLKIAASGRMAIPLRMRKAMRLAGGDLLIARIEDGAIVLEPIGLAMARAKAKIAAIGEQEPLVAAAGVAAPRLTGDDPRP